MLRCAVAAIDQIAVVDGSNELSLESEATSTDSEEASGVGHADPSLDEGLEQINRFLAADCAEKEGK